MSALIKQALNSGALSGVMGALSSQEKPKELKSYNTDDAENEAKEKIQKIINKYEGAIGDLFQKSLANVLNNITDNKGVLEENINNFIITKILDSIVADQSVEKSLFQILVSKLDNEELEAILQNSNSENIVDVFSSNINPLNQSGGDGVTDMVGSVLSNASNIGDTVSNVGDIANVVAPSDTKTKPGVVDNASNETKVDAEKPESIDTGAIPNETLEIAKILDFFPKDTTGEVVNKDILYIIEQSIKSVLDKKEHTDLIYKKITEPIIPNLKAFLEKHIETLTNNEQYMVKRYLLKLLEKNSDIRIGLQQSYASDTKTFKNNIETKFTALKNNIRTADNSSTKLPVTDLTTAPLPGADLNLHRYKINTVISDTDNVQTTDTLLPPPPPPANTTIVGGKKGLNKKTNKNKKSKRSRIQKRKTRKSRK